MVEKVWYCSYGSNLLEERFKLYIEGGTSPLVNKIYDGCTDKTMPTKSKLYKINYEMYFAEKAEFWEDKAVAFISHKKGNSFTYARLYLITVEQFHEIVTQENTQFSSSSISKLIDLKELESKGSLLLGSPDENKLYGKVILVGTEEGFPIITFTSKSEIDKVKFKKPGEKYLGTIIKGLSDLDHSENIDYENILSYFENLKGIKGKIKTNKLKKNYYFKYSFKKRSPTN